MIARLAALALAVALAVPAARAGDVSARATLHVRATAAENLPGRDVLFDRENLGFDLAGYLEPAEDDRYGSTFASFSLDGRAMDGDVRWRLALDTGELRRRASPLVTVVCRTPQDSSTGTGLELAGPNPCANPPRIPLQDTRVGATELTSNGRPLADEAEATLLVREAYAALSFGRAGFATVRAGRKRISVADGYVYDDYGTGAELALDLGAIGPPLALTLSLFQPTRDTPDRFEDLSPLLAVRADWLPSLFENAGLFLAAHRDRTGSAAELFRGAIIERTVAFLAQAPFASQSYRIANRSLALTLGLPLESDATMVWVGTSGRLVPWRGQRVGWTAGLLRGRIDHVAIAGAPVAPIAEDVTLRGRLLSATWDVDLGERVVVGASFLFLSGGTFPFEPGATARGEYAGFLGVAPFVTATNLFFGGGLSESFAARQSTAPGVNGRGVTAPGLSVAFDPTDTVGLELKGAYLTAPVEGPFGGRVYGTELDAVLSWSPLAWLVVGAELDVLWPGDFFAGDETVFKTVLALDLVTP